MILLFLYVFFMMTLMVAAGLYDYMQEYREDVFHEAYEYVQELRREDRIKS